MTGASRDRLAQIARRELARRGVVLPDGWDAATVDNILGGRQVTNPAQYLADSIRRERDPQTRWGRHRY